MAGSITGAVIAMIGHVGERVAHGGPIVAVLGAVDNVSMFFAAVIVGSTVTAVLVNVLKKDVSKIEKQEIEQIKEVSATIEVQQIEQEAQSKSSQVEKMRIKKLTDITNLELIETDLKGGTRDDILDEMIQKLKHVGALHSVTEFKQAIMNREQECTTGIGVNIAIPHGKSDAVRKPSVVFGIKQSGVNWKSLDGTKAKLIFMIAVPKENEENQHLKILQMLSRKLMDDSYRERLLSVQTKEEAYKLLGEIA
ncbi:PTS system, fructose subfamily, IIA component [Bacillus cereus VD045]|nr:PTS system, fructose subfamily, IIA component [Bacillus cereus VD045]